MPRGGRRGVHVDVSVSGGGRHHHHHHHHAGAGALIGAAAVGAVAGAAVASSGNNKKSQPPPKQSSGTTVVVVNKQAPPPQQTYAPPPQQTYAPPPQQAYAPPPQQATVVVAPTPGPAPGATVVVTKQAPPPQQPAATVVVAPAPAVAPAATVVVAPTPAPAAPAAPVPHRALKLGKRFQNGNQLYLTSLSSKENLRLKKMFKKIDGGGGKKDYSTWHVAHAGIGKITLRNVADPKSYVAVTNPDTLTYVETGGVECEFFVVKHGKYGGGDRVYSFESCAYPGTFIGFDAKGNAKEPKHTNVGIDGQFYVMKK